MVRCGMHDRRREVGDRDKKTVYGMICVTEMWEMVKVQSPDDL